MTQTHKIVISRKSRSNKLRGVGLLVIKSDELTPAETHKLSKRLNEALDKGSIAVISASESATINFFRI